jgi:methyl-accepting chemotaxis protein
MPTEFTTGINIGSSGRAAAVGAVESALENMDASRPDFALVLASPEYDPQEVVDTVQTKTGVDSLLGCTTAGEFTDERVENGSVTVSLVASDSIKFFTGLGRGLNDDIEKAVLEATASLPTAVKDYPHMVGINLHDGLSGRGEEITMLAYQQLPIPFTGGAAGDNLLLEETIVFTEDGLSNNGIALGLMASKKPFTLDVGHGHTPISDGHTVTAVDGNAVTELDGRPAFEVWKEAVREPAKEVYDIDVDELSADDQELTELMALFEFGIKTGDDQYNVRWPGVVPSTDGPLHFATTIPEGTELYPMHSPPDDQIESARETARRAMAEHDEQGIAGAFVFDCACRAAILGDEFDAAVEAIADEIDAPIAGLETYGEVCLRGGDMRAYHNTTSSLVLIPE